MLRILTEVAMNGRVWLLIAVVTAILAAGCGKGPSDPNMPGDMPMQAASPDSGSATVTQ